MSDAEAEQAREGLVQEKGFFILPSELFCNVRAKAANDENLNETLETVFRHIEESAKGSSSEGQFAGLFDDYDVNSNKLGQKEKSGFSVQTSQLTSAFSCKADFFWHGATIYQT